MDDPVAFGCSRPSTTASSAVEKSRHAAATATVNRDLIGVGDSGVKMAPSKAQGLIDVREYVCNNASSLALAGCESAALTHSRDWMSSEPDSLSSSPHRVISRQVCLKLPALHLDAHRFWLAGYANCLTSQADRVTAHPVCLVAGPVCLIAATVCLVAPTACLASPFS
jgi:hypothetical protein